VICIPFYVILCIRQSYKRWLTSAQLNVTPTTHIKLNLYCITPLVLPVLATVTVLLALVIVVDELDMLVEVCVVLGDVLVVRTAVLVITVDGLLKPCVLPAPPVAVECLPVSGRVVAA